MISDKHYKPAVYAKLSVLVQSGNDQSLTDWLSSLSNASFRTAGYMLGERIMQTVPKERFWQLFRSLVAYNTRAFLVTMLKAYLLRHSQTKDVSLRNEGFLSVCSLLRQNETDCRKTLHELLPTLTDPDEVRFLFNALGMTDQTEWIPFLIPVSTMPARFLLFNSLHFIDHDQPQLIRIACLLVKQGDGLSFNLASLMKTYFGLPRPQGTFSLNLQPYELARIAGSYDVFFRVMKF